MKNIFFLFAMSVISTICQAQRVTYNDLNYVMTHSVDETKAYLLSKGFSYDGKINVNVEHKTSLVQFVKKFKKYEDKLEISKGLKNEQSTSAAFNTYQKEDYVLFKDYIEKMGFKMTTSTTTSNGTLITFYAKDNMWVTFAFSQMGDPPKKDFYIITLMPKSR